MDNSTRSTGRQVDKSTGRQVNRSTSRQINNAKIANTNPNLTIDLTGSFLLTIALGRQVDRSTSPQVDKSILPKYING